MLSFWSFLFEIGVKNDFCQAVKESRAKKQKKCSPEMKETEENKKKSKCHKKNQKQVLQESPPNGYIHVRARRGQATDSHSLAERVLLTTNF